ncbi:hypothetical protein [Paenibacillus typhae]|uniref:hypothetical protein n=1 Tax=Paenibacillus typhae TaxID=1174501 RepID=UPI001113DC5A|nr:hypothetical protein [Paenibacillus typhae]
MDAEATIEKNMIAVLIGLPERFRRLFFVTGHCRRMKSTGFDGENNTKISLYNLLQKNVEIKEKKG